MRVSLLVILSVCIALVSALCRDERTLDECLHDNEGCEWTEHFGFCYNPSKGGDAICDRIHDRHDCHHFKCSWDSEYNICHEPSLPFPCQHLPAQHDCEYHKDCAWTAGACRIKNTLVECNELKDGDSCHNNDHCWWDQARLRCVAKDQPIACQLRTVEDCDIDDYCVVNYDIPACLQRGQRLSCDIFNRIDSCSKYSKCEWNQILQSCVRKGKPLFCEKINNENICKSLSHCEYNHGASKCFKAGVPLACTWYHDRSYCEADENCEFSTILTRCVKKGDSLPCREYYTKESECLAAGCGFIRNHCMQKEHAVSCYLYPSKRECLHFGCIWSPTTLTCGESEVAESKIETPDFDEEEEMLRQHKARPNNYCAHVRCDEIALNCGVGQRPGVHSQHCCPSCSFSNRFCQQFNTKSLCPNEGCEFHEKTKECNSLGISPKCELFRVAQECEEISSCQWSKKSLTCSFNNTLPDCIYFPEQKACKRLNHCKFNKETAVCEPTTSPVPCHALKSTNACNMHSQRCIFDDQIRSCRERDEMPSCVLYDEKGCGSHSDRCQFDFDANACMPMGVFPPCHAYKSLGGCENNGNRCYWSDHHKECVTRVAYEAIPCTEHYFETACKQQQSCQWWTDVMACTNEGVPPSCSYLTKPEWCAYNKDCHYIKGAERCINAADHDIDNNNNNNNNNNNTALVVQAKCEVFYNDDQCQSQSHCFWSSDVLMCLQQGSPIPCRFLHKIDKCQALDHCVWSNETLACYTKGTQLQCQQVRVKTACRTMQNCTWLADLRQCIDKTSNSCQTIVSDVSCSKLSNCEWHYNGHMCINKGKQLQCHDLRYEMGCRATRHCGWDAKHFRCRRLREEL